MAKWSNGAVAGENGATTGREDLRTFLNEYLGAARKSLQKDRDYLLQYHARLSGRDVMDKDITTLTAAEMDKVLSS